MNTLLILIILIVAFSLIALIVFLARKYIPIFKDDGKPVTKEQAAKENLERILVPIEEDEKEEKLLDKNEKHPE